jgi:hypothetical protein
VIAPVSDADAIAPGLPFDVDPDPAPVAYLTWADHVRIVAEYQRVIDRLMATVDRLQGHSYGGEA